MLKWNVYIGDFNSGTIESYNVFCHAAFLEECKKIVKKHQKALKGNGIFDRQTFSNEIRRSMMYYFWGKCEWEIIIDHWPQSDRRKSEKVDVFDQVGLNWDVFIDYIWSNREELIKCRK